jgi:hypothetical protein
MSPKDGESLLLPKRNKDLLASAKMLGSLALLFSLPLEAGTSDVAAVGVVDAASCSLRSVSVLGVSFTARDEAVAQKICASNLQPGLAFVSVVGVLNDEGLIELEQFNFLSAEEYVPGVSLVYLRGNVSWSDPLTGRFSINGAQVAVGDTTPLIGAQVEVVGSQPIGGGLILSDIVWPAGIELRRQFFEVSTNSSSGTGKLSSSGTGFNSSVGSAVLSSSGTGKLSSSGTGLNSSVGSGVLSSSGTGLNSSVGSGVLSSSGTGKLSSSGTGLNSSVGSGVISSSGTGLNSSVGSGVLSSSGTGKLSSSGTGLNSSVGSGVLSSSGTGLNSSVGSGVLSSSGTGKLSSSGTGLNSSVGSGVLSSSGTGLNSSAETELFSSVGTGF